MNSTKLLWILIIFLILVNFYQFLGYKKLNENYLMYVKNSETRIEELETKNNQLNEEILNSKKMIEKLTEEKNKLNMSLKEMEYNYTQLSNRYEKISRDYQELKKEAETLLERLDKYYKEINESMSWFLKNSNIKNMNNSLRKSIEDDLKFECYRIVFDECRIKTACLYLLNEKYYGLMYLTDANIYRKNDKLSSLDEFITNKGGDCEDYSLFYKAQMNNILDSCKDKRIIIESYFESANGKRYFVNFRETWFIRDVEVKEIESNNIYPYVVCYLTEPNIGHCVVALSKYKINNSNQVNLLNGAWLIEPQDGSYVGEIGNKIRLPVVPKQINELMIIISDDDLYSFSEEGWIGYNDFKEEIVEMKNELLLYVK